MIQSLKMVSRRWHVAAPNYGDLAVKDANKSIIMRLFAWQHTANRWQYSICTVVMYVHVNLFCSWRKEYNLFSIISYNLFMPFSISNKQSNQIWYGCEGEWYQFQLLARVFVCFLPFHCSHLLFWVFILS